MEERRKRRQRASSLDFHLSGGQKTELHKLQEEATHSRCDGYYVTAEAPLPNDPDHKVIVMEKLTEPVELAREAKEEEDEENYVQIRSPTSREKISIMAVMDRCRVYEDSDEYKYREEVKAKTEPAKPQKLDATEDESQKTKSRQKKETGHESIVKNLREKFQKLS